MSSNRSSEFEIFTDFQFFNKQSEDREYSEDFLLLIGHSVSMHLLLAEQLCFLCFLCACLLFFLELYQQGLAQAAGNRLVSNRDGDVGIYRTTPDVIADGRCITDELNFLRLG